MKNGTKCRLGFSLMEVNLAVLMISVGLLTLFALFPLGLKESEMSVVETQESMFADSVLSGLEANAMTITDIQEWTDMDVNFTNKLKSSVYPIEHPTPGAGGWSCTNFSDAVKYPHVSDPLAIDRYIRYHIDIVSSGLRKSVVLTIKSGRLGDFALDSHVFYTDLIYMGM
ncbi:MAG: hypothetical protein JXN60_04250 [Lentisphaerae bacterium]|nr:hypothetical protein [Lentisphaerota bacterium]